MCHVRLLIALIFKVRPAKIDGKVTFVEDAIAGEFVECVINKKTVFQLCKSQVYGVLTHRVIPDMVL